LPSAQAQQKSSVCVCPCVPLTATVQHGAIGRGGGWGGCVGQARDRARRRTRRTEIRTDPTPTRPSPRGGAGGVDASGRIIAAAAAAAALPTCPRVHRPVWDRARGALLLVASGAAAVQVEVEAMAVEARRGDAGRHRRRGRADTVTR